MYGYCQVSSRNLLWPIPRSLSRVLVNIQGQAGAADRRMECRDLHSVRGFKPMTCAGCVFQGRRFSIKAFSPLDIQGMFEE